MSEFPEIDGGWRIAEDDTHYYDVLRMMFNYRVVNTRKDLPAVYDSGFCYVGTGPATQLLATAAALEWCRSGRDEPLHWNENITTGEFREDGHSEGPLAQPAEEGPGTRG